MKRAAIGIRAHSGWAAAVAVAGDLSTPEILDRQRIAVVEPGVRGASQPYHFAKGLRLKDAEDHLATCAKAARRLAVEGLQAMMQSVRKSGYEIIHFAILTASGRPLPPLTETLASHAMIHTAEGEFFRKAFADACDELGIVVSKVREREVFDRAAAELRVRTSQLMVNLATLGREIGPPWTQDQKGAALAAWLLLGGSRKVRR
jgi:hypothetical protein